MMPTSFGKRGNKGNMKTVMSIMLAVYAIVFVTGCKHTAHGAGEDMEKAGEKIQEKSK